MKTIKVKDVEIYGENGRLPMPKSTFADLKKRNPELVKLLKRGIIAERLLKIERIENDITKKN